MTADQREIFETWGWTSTWRHRARRARRREGDRRPRRALAAAVPAAARRRPDALGLRHRHVPHVSPEVQVRARVPDPDGADAEPALRDPRAPGARALPRRRRLALDARRAPGAAGRRLAARRLLGHRRRGAAALEGDRGVDPLPRALPGRGRRAGLVRAPVHVQARAPRPARPRRPGRSPAPTAPTSSSNTSGPAQDAEPAQGGRAAGALRGGGARGLAARVGRAVVLLRARRREGARGEQGEAVRDWIRETVLEVGEGILAQASSRRRRLRCAPPATFASSARRQSDSGLRPPGFALARHGPH